jgi:hypothetical protein
MSLVISIISLTTSILVSIILYIKLKSVYINLYNLSKGLDILFENQKKILELTKVKGFVQLINEENRNIKQEVEQEKSKVGDKKVKGSIRPLDSNPNDERS